MKGKLRRRESLTGFFLILPSLAGFLVFFALPFAIVIGYTFTSGIGKVSFTGLKHYAEIFRNDSFRLAALNTLKFSLVSVPLIMLVSFMLAAALRNRNSPVWRSLIILPLVVPSAAVVTVFRITFAKSGPFSTLMGWSADFDPLNSSFAFWVLVIFYIWKNAGYTMILSMAGMQTIPRVYYQAAQVDGAGFWAQTRYITLPLMIPTFVLVFTIAVIRSFQSFREAFLLSGDYPHESVYLLQHFMNNNFKNLNYQRLSVAALFVFLIIFARVLVLQRVRNRAEADIL